MASTFGSLETARSGLTAAQLGLNVTGQNVANANTTGYTRQTLNAVAVSADTGFYQLAPTTVSAGRGVKITDIYQVRDSFLDVNYRDENAQYNLYSGMQSQLTSIEDYFTEISTDTATTNKLTGLSGQLDSLIEDLKKYETDATNSDLSATIKGDVSVLASSIRSDANNLATTMENEQSELGIIVTGKGAGDTSNGETDGGINGIITNIQQLNIQISGYEAGTGQQASDLRDERNTLLDKLSGYLDINVTEQSNGMVTVGLKNDSTPIIDSQNSANHFTVGYLSTSDATTGTGTDTYALQWDGKTVKSDGTTTTTGAPTGEVGVEGGLVKAYLNVINGDGSGTGEYGNVGLVYMMRKLNAFAVGLGETINDSNSAVDTTNIDTSTDLVSYDDPPTTDTTGTVDGVLSKLMYAASSISISSDWSTTPDLFLTRYTDDGGTDTSAYLTDYVNALNGTSGLVNTVTGSVNAAATATTAYTGTLSNYADTFSTDIASAVSTVSTQADTSETNLNNFESERESISSVSTDDEAVNIIKYQQAYSANARVITTLDEMLDKLINGTGTVGLS